MTSSAVIEFREKVYLLLIDDAQFYKLPPPLDRAWVVGIRCEAGEALKMAREMYPDMFKDSE